MNEIKQAGQPVTRENEQDAEARNPANELRQLSDLELALAGGGDDVVSWP